MSYLRKKEEKGKKEKRERERERARKEGEEDGKKIQANVAFADFGGSQRCEATEQQGWLVRSVCCTSEFRTHWAARRAARAL